ncbi:MAG: AmmeMemoRadiSam system protein B [Candidatus Caldarchaeum sp.]
MPKRRPAVAGAFYAGTKNSLFQQIKECFTSPLGPGSLPTAKWSDRKVPALICPHAGYMYSGPVAAHAYWALTSYSKPDSVIIFGPNHYGVGTAVSIYPEGSWLTPLGEVSIDKNLVNQLAGHSDVFFFDEVSHSREHSIEVQLPFLQYIYESFSFVPICINDQSLETCIRIGRDVAEVVDDRNILMIASTDFTHYEPHEEVLEKDKKALEKIVKLNVEELYSAMKRYDITMCGYGAVAALLTAAKMLGAREAKVLKQTTSGDTSGDYDSVVGYASCLIELEKR